MTALTGIGWLSILCAIPLFYAFKGKRFGFFDPLNIFLLMRVAPMLASIIIFFIYAEFNINFILFTSSTIFFIATLYWATPKVKITRLDFDERSIKFFLRLAILLFSIKILILTSATGGLPIFLDGGSDAYIEFDVNNKLGSTFLLGLGGVDLILFAFIIPFIKKIRLRIFYIFFILFAILIAMSSGKKSSVLMIFMSIIFGEYLRINLFANQNKFFLKSLNVYVGIALSIFWAIWTYTKTTGIDLTLPDASTVTLLLDFVMYQWAYPFMLYVSGELNDFFRVYYVNNLTYFFHSLLSPLGFPAFTNSIGPSIHEYLSGEMSGNGINPTFLIEGYVLVGIFVPLYAIFAGYIVGVGRLYIMKIKSIEYKVVLSALLIPGLYAFPIDGLLFMKIIYVVFFIFIFFVIPLRYLSRAAR